ncbi:MAG: hypothetical protein ABI882_19695, partial [Acidobacteriota bacterium]
TADEVIHVNSQPDSRLNTVAIFGLVLGAVFGLAGTLVSDPILQASFWAIDAVGLVVASALLTLKYYKRESDFVAAGFLVFAIGEGIILSGTAAGPIASLSSFAAGIALWAAGLTLVSIPKEFPLLVRLAGVVGAVLFAVTAARIFLGEALPATATPLPFFAYPFLVATIIGWIWTLLSELRSR